MSRLIFINPAVLGATIFPVPTPEFPFDSKACEAFRDLMLKVEDAAIVILTSRTPSLERLKKAWEDAGLFGNRIIDVIGSRGGILFPTHSVHNYLRRFHPWSEGKFEFDSFVIVDGMPCEDSYPDRLVDVKERLTNDDVERIVKILSQPFSTRQIQNIFREPVQARGGECVCS